MAGKEFTNSGPPLLPGKANTWVPREERMWTERWRGGEKGKGGGLDGCVAWGGWWKRREELRRGGGVLGFVVGNKGKDGGGRGGDMCFGEEGVVASQEHAARKIVDEGEGLEVEIAEHGVGTPPQHQANDIGVYASAEEGHGAARMESAGRHVGQKETKDRARGRRWRCIGGWRPWPG